MPNALFYDWCPPALRRLLNQSVGAQTRYHGPFPNWTAASAATDGYDEGAILDRVADTTRRVLQGAVGFEQDGILRPGAPPPSHAQSALLLAAARGGGVLSVLDFGGGLGSHFLRWRPLLQQLSELRWYVVEQPAFAKVGGRLFEGIADVTFLDTIEAAASHAPNAVFASSVLQYLATPLEHLHRLIELDADVFVLDRMPFARDGVERILAQYVPASLGRASYPLRMFSREAIQSMLRARYRCVLEFESGDMPMELPGMRADYVGQVWVRDR